MDIVQLAKDFAKAQITMVATEKDLVEFLRFNRDVEEIIVDIDGETFKVSLAVCGGGFLPSGYGVSVTKIIVDPEVLKAKKRKTV